jgi:hypothetical protein
MVGQQDDLLLVFLIPDDNPAEALAVQEENRA